MKKISTLSILACLFFISCEEQFPVEKMIPSSSIELSGTQANAISVAGEARMFMTRKEDNHDLWAIRVSIPVECAEQQSADVDYLKKSNLCLIDSLSSEFNGDSFDCEVQDSSLIINLIHSAPGTQMTVDFVQKNQDLSYGDYQNISSAIERTEKLFLSFEFGSSAFDKDSVSSPSISNTISNTFKETKKEMSDAFKDAKEDVSNSVKKVKKDISKTFKDIF